MPMMLFAATRPTSLRPRHQGKDYGFDEEEKPSKPNQSEAYGFDEE